MELEREAEDRSRIRFALVGWPQPIGPLPPVSCWAESPHQAWRDFDEQVAALAREPWHLPVEPAFVLTTRVDALPAGLDRRHWLPLRGRADWVQCLRGCGRRVWPRNLSTAHQSCPICGGGLRPWVHLPQDGGWLEGANAGAENRFRDAVERARGQRVEVWHRQLAGDRTLVRLAERLRRTLVATVGNP